MRDESFCVENMKNKSEFNSARNFISAASWQHKEYEEGFGSFFLFVCLKKQNYET
jgi:hypothetical protein